MTQKDPSDFDPKHRIIGAVIIVSLAVIFVPMILDRRSAPETPNVSEIPAPTSAPDNKVVVTPVPPLEPRPSAAAVEAQSPKSTAASEPPKPAAAQPPKAAADTPPAATKPTPKSASAAPAKTPTKPAAKPPAKPEPNAAPVKSGWVVQVGTFANAANATRLEEQLKQHGHAVSRERIASNGGSALRLRVGPFKDKTLAIKAQGQIQKETGVQGVVLAYP